MPMLHRHCMLLLVICTIICSMFVQHLQGIPVNRSIKLAEGNNQVEFKVEQSTEANEHVFIGRSDIESDDYPGSGANRSHEPGGGSRSPDHPRAP